ncbi:MAG: S41 family peptidase [Chromatiaceae bacterium]|nr:S41 family peptidase [Chromatiaceae bacterium]MCP5444796.1 S41 family peptidase [Chromatiaceae bacterium]
MKHRTGLVFSFGLVFALGGALGPGFGTAAEKEALPMQDLRAFAEIFGRIKQDYVEPVADRELLEHAIRGMLSGLDPHSAYLNADEYKSLQVGTTGEFGGLGIEVGLEDGFVKVIAPIDDTPAQRAGVLAGDLIIKLDDRPIKGVSLDEAVKLMRGKKGTSITLTIAREGEKKPIVITVVRDVIRVASIKSRMLEEGFGYLRISHFQSRSTQDMLQHLSELKSQSGGKLRGLVLDLRNNPGGILNGAVAVSDAFLTEGIIVYTQGRDAESRLDFTAAPDDVLEGSPIVVLVNGGSASASEIVAGALQDHKRAVIMGTRTFGKGSVQTIVPVNGHSAVKLTTARYFTPLGRSIQAEGITPDIQLPDAKVTSVKKPDLTQVKESDLGGHLVNENQDENVKQKEGEKKDSEISLAESDYQLSEALNLLKALFILDKKG